MARRKVSFRATKKIKKPVRVSFWTKKGKKVSFRATKKIKKPVRVSFWTKKRKKKRRK